MDSARYLPVVMGVVLLLLLAPLSRERTRAALGAVLLLGCGGMAVVGYLNLETLRVLDVVNAFNVPDPDATTGRRVELLVTETVRAPGWHWPMIAGLGLLVPGAWILLRRARGRAIPCPLTLPVMIGLWAIALRLGLEKTAAPQGLVWAIGLTNVSLLVMVFAGGYAGAKGLGVATWIGTLVGFAAVTRGAVVALSHWVTTRGLGTHLDLRRLGDISPPGVGVIRLDGATDVERWRQGMLHAQLFWAAATVLAGVLLGAIPYAITRRRRAARPEA